MIPNHRAVATIILLVALATGVGLTASVAAQDEPTIAVGDATVDAGGSVTVDVVLTETPEGLAGYEITVALEGDGTARIDGAEYPDTLELTSDPVIGADERTVRLEGADLAERIQPGAEDVRLGTVAVTGDGAGEATIAVADVQIDADGGDRVSPAVEPGGLTIEASEPTATATPTASGDGNGASARANTESTVANADDSISRTDVDDSTSRTDADATPAASGPGFGPLLAVFALLGGSLLVARRR